MLFSLAQYALRFLTATLIAVAFVYAPLAEAGHSENAFEITCEADHNNVSDGENEQHDHHIHNCGPCLQHLLRIDCGHLGIFNNSQRIRLQFVNEGLIPSSSGSPYRPPRS